MKPKIEQYYERELAFISSGRDPLARYYRKQYPAEGTFASTYARRYPAQAGQLELDADSAEDPHANRLIQAFALLAGRIHHKIDEEFPKLTEALLSILYPHLLLPVPSMAMAQFHSDFTHKEAIEGIHIPKNSSLISRPVGHPPTPCRWRTGYPVDLWPVRLSEADMKPYAYFSELPLTRDTGSVLRLFLECLGGLRFADLELETLRFYCSGDRAVVAFLYELLFNNTLQVLIRDPEQPDRPPLVLSPQDCLKQVGLDLDEGILPFPCESFIGYRLLTEFFTFPYKFLFLDLQVFRQAREAGFGSTMEVFLLVNRSQEDLVREVSQAVTTSTFQLGCTPVINLFSRLAAPIALTHTRHEYEIFPEYGCAPNGIEIYSIDEVNVFDPNTGILKDYQPFYSFTYDQNRDSHKTFWYASRRASPLEKIHTQDVFLVLVNRDFNPQTPAEDTVNVYVTCTNGELPSQFLRVGDKLILGGAPFRGTIQLMHAPTASWRPHLQKGTFWRWLSQTALGRTPLSFAAEGLDALKETLLLCAAKNLVIGHKQQEAIIQQLLDGIIRFEGRRVTRSLTTGLRTAACRGVEFSLELDRRKYVGTGAFLFACVLERFLGLYTSVNSFTQLVLQIQQGQGPLKQWPPRAAEHLLT